MTLPRWIAAHVLALLLCLLASNSVAAPLDPPKSGGIIANPTSVDFGNVQVGKNKTQTVTLTDTTTISLTIYASTITGAGFSSSGLTLPMTLTAGQSYTFSVIFAPTASGSSSGNITFTSRRGSAKLTIGLTGNGTSAGTLAVSPTSQNFGSVTVGSSKSLTGSLTATGADVTVSSGTVGTSEFKISGITFPVTIKSGKSATFTVTFTPQTSGSASDSASFVSDASNSPAVEGLTGQGTSAPPHNVDLGWTASTSSDVVGYNVYRGSKSGGPYSKINTALDPSTTYDDAGVVSGQTYYYVTTAVDGSGTESSYSNQAKATIPSP